MSAAALYTPQVLAAAVDLAAYPLDPGAPFQGHASARACGSTLDLSITLDDAGTIQRIGARARSCAIGQAAAVLFVRGAAGHTGATIAAARDAMVRWLADAEAPLPDWPGLSLIERARAYPARHGAILLPWNAALDALASVAVPG
ncbi:iron-sulfur cluster assembly scaffold protein [Novosphingobium tardum]|uniref:Iron-sulfur cluster assembly scaffold protein n=1 Tax=Novosphingobium tardum TaxID=1538021 RepID=A0ABV8RQN4_9SPHN